MGTNIRPNISTKNKYWISKHRYYELKHFCLQYPSWKKAYASLTDLCISSPILDEYIETSDHSDLTAKYALARLYYSERIEMVEQAAFEADEVLGKYILKAVTEDVSYSYLQSKLSIPCSRDTYYNRYRKFFWILSKYRK